MAGRQEVTEILDWYEDGYRIYSGERKDVRHFYLSIENSNAPVDAELRAVLDRCKAVLKPRRPGRMRKGEHLKRARDKRIAFERKLPRFHAEFAMAPEAPSKKTPTSVEGEKPIGSRIFAWVKRTFGV